LSDYATANEVRVAANFSSSEWPDASLSQLIADATSEIDTLTGSTWQGVSNVINQYLDGDGTKYLKLPVSDNVMITALAIDISNSGNYTAINMSSASNNTSSNVRWYTHGVVYLDSDAEVPLFTKGVKTIRISYTHGVAAPTNTVRRLCVYKVLQYINFDADRQQSIDSMVQLLSAHRFV